MTTEHEASRTLVKSPPELWAECSDAGSLARHLGEFGEIKITRLEPESTVAWEGEHVSGTVRIEPSGWGTRVTLTAQTKAESVVPHLVSEALPDEPGQVAGPGVPLFAQAPEIAGQETSDNPSAKLEGEAPADVEPLSQGPTTPTAEEERDAKVEETLEDAIPAPVDDTGGPRARWRRIAARMRGFFGAHDPVEEEPALTEPETEREPDPDPEPTREPDPDPEPTREPDPDPEPTREPEAAVVPDLHSPQPEPQPEPELQPEPEVDAEAILTSALDSLGQAHHRPFSRA